MEFIVICMEVLKKTSGRFKGNLCFDYYDMNFRKLALTWGRPQSNIIRECPFQFEEMKNICRMLSKNILHVRVDLYLINSKIYFGEMTFYDGGGFSEFNDPEWDLKLGEMLLLPVK